MNGSPGVALQVKKKSAFYRPELDALRFCAFLMVFVSHVIPPDVPLFVQRLHIPVWLAKGIINAALAGTFGVYLFFTLSAYLITTLLLREKESFGRLNIGSFYVRRALRIWPLYALVLIAGTAYAVAFKPADLHAIPYFLLLAGNWIEAFGFTPSFILVALWSISVEEQFYLFWPQIVARIGTMAVKRWAFAMLAAPMPFIPLAFALGFHARLFVFTNSFSCISAMGVGILLACNAPKVNRPACMACAVVCWFVAALLIGSTAFSSVSAIALVNAGSALFLLAALGRPTSRVSAYLGKVSYGLYVYHLAAVTACTALIGTVRPSRYLVTVTASLFLTILMAAISYRFIETPFLKLKSRFALIESRPV
jgi:peptidoglycan/LPS O-acetylase OafA/YrhL